jgi:mannose-1-phosphate guanylyltransferase
MRWAVILAGGSGTRFWPLSTPTSPKQLLPLAGSSSTAEQTVARLEGLISKDHLLVVTGASLAPRLTEALGLDPANVLVEPRAASTGPALVWASAEALRRDPEAQVLSLHADWVIREDEAFPSNGGGRTGHRGTTSPPGDGGHRSFATGYRIWLYRPGIATR